MRVPGIPYVQGRNSYSRRSPHYGIAIHNTSNDATAEGEADFATGRTDGISAHFYVDNNSVVQSLDTHARAGHAASQQGNDYAIAVEITGTNDKSRAWWLANVAWDKLGAVLAWVIRNDPDYRGFAVRRAPVAEMKSNPKVKAFYGHDDMRRAWGVTTHTDPGPNFPWDRLFQAVNAALNPPSTPEVPEMIRLKAKDGAARYLSNGAHIPSTKVDDALEAKGVPLVEVDTTAELQALLPPAPVEIDYGRLGEEVLAALLQRAMQS